MKYSASAGGLKKHVYGKEDHSVNRKRRTYRTIGMLGSR
jgi:hypothetical protein